MGGSNGGRNPRHERVGRLSEDEVERRLGGGAGLASQARLTARARTTRRGLVLDTATLLGGVAIMLVAAQLLSPAAPLASATSSPTGAAEVAIGSLVAGATFPPFDTVGPIVNPSFGVGPSPSPSPAVTLPATGPSPTPRPTARPTATPPPKPTPTPTAEVTATPTSAATPTPPPAVASFDCTAAGLVLTCDGSASTGAASYSWDWGDGSAAGAGASPPPHTYGSAATFRVTLTVSPVGPDSVQSHDYVLGP
jgi:hypothetical protein